MSFGLHRRPERETWVEYVQRSAHEVDEIAERHDMKNWVAESRRRKWRFAGQLARRTDKRWSSLLVAWVPAYGPGRSPGRPFTRWTTDFERLAGGDWMKVAHDENLWRHLQDGFVQRCVG